MSKALSSFYFPLKFEAGKVREVKEAIVEEENIRFYLNHKPIASTTATPYNLEELSIGFLFSAGYIGGNLNCEISIDKKSNLVDIAVNVIAVESQDIKSLQERPCNFRISTKEIDRLITINFRENTLGKLTHGTHACSFWGKEGYYSTFIDVKRHNAVDKLVGSLILNKKPAVGALFLSGRASSEMIIKCAKAKIPILISKGTTTTLGIKLAKKFDITLVCYSRPGKIVVFNKPERIIHGG